MLKGRISLPVPLGTVSSTAALQPGARLSQALLGNPSEARLGCILAALGLAQNLAAMAALVGEGIQSGHMRLHARRTAYLAGARGDEIYQIADQLSLSGSISLDSARQLFDQLRSQDS
jgi:hydroxymethylglutaryl-CoA reductase